MIILGIDPGIAITGYGIIKTLNAGQYDAVVAGTIQTEKKLSVSQRLKIIYHEITQLIKKYNPNEIAIEELFFSKNSKTAIAVSQARGVLLLSCEHQNKPIFEYSPLQIKLGVTGYGKADKNQVAKMVSIILRLTELPKQDDAADALAIAICHVNQRKFDLG